MKSAAIADDPGAVIERLQDDLARTRALLGRVVRLERWVSIGGINSHAKLSPIRREVWDEVVEELKRGR